MKPTQVMPLSFTKADGGMVGREEGEGGVSTGKHCEASGIQAVWEAVSGCRVDCQHAGLASHALSTPRTRRTHKALADT